MPANRAEYIEFIAVQLILPRLAIKYIGAVDSPVCPRRHNSKKATVAWWTNLDIESST